MLFQIPLFMGLTQFVREEPLGLLIVEWGIEFSRGTADGKALQLIKDGYVKDDISLRLLVSKSLGL